MREARDRIADNEREAAYNRILQLIRKAGRGGITPGSLSDKCRNVDTRMRLQLVADLESSGRVLRVTQQSGGRGRPSERLICTEFPR
jgi:hypothetical protein